MARNLRKHLALCIVAAAPVALFASDALAKHYVVAFNQTSGLPNNVDQLVAAAGGTITERIPEIGGIGVESDNANFASMIARTSSVKAADVATEMFEQELALGLAQHVRTHLVDIDDALARIEAGEYGLCEDCGEPIVPERLRALPRARRCVPCQQMRETAARTGRSIAPVSFTAAAKRKAQPARKPTSAAKRTTFSV